MMVFLTLLTMAIGMIAVLGVVFVGLFEAPWPVLVVVLVAGLFTLQRLSTQVQSLLEQDTIALDLTTPESGGSGKVADVTDANGKGLKYRGVGYQREGSAIAATAPEATVAKEDAAAAAAEGEAATAKVAGYYRGRRWERSTPPEIQSTPPHPSIVYRGRKVSSAASDSEPGTSTHSGASLPETEVQDT